MLLDLFSIAVFCLSSFFTKLLNQTLRLHLLHHFFMPRILSLRTLLLYRQHFVLLYRLESLYFPLLLDPIILKKLVDVVILIEAVLNAVLVEHVSISLIVHICSIIIKVIFLRCLNFVTAT